MMQRIGAIGCLWLLFLLFATNGANAQENLAPIDHNPFLSRKASPVNGPLKRTTALTLPFFEDFTDYTLYPNQARWQDSEVYVNNTMCVHPISRGVATFDALNKYGRPYDTVYNLDETFGDSLTSQSIALASFAPSDSIYLSFFYQPQGNGFSPDPQDSLELYFHRKNDTWDLVWAVPGDSVRSFTQVLLPIADTNYLYDNFQFRFVNKISINTNDDVWNVDYIKIDKGRNYRDTVVSDLAYTTNPTYILNDYTCMTYRQFLANPNAVRTATHTDTIWNHYLTNATVNYGYSATELTTGTALGGGTGSIATFLPNSLRQISFPTYTTTVPLVNNYDKVVFENKYYLSSGNPNEPNRANDTIIRDQIFDNYLAYDDGSAEKSYFLTLFSGLPGKLAIEYNLALPDTLRGMSIYFGRQVPTAYNKQFSLMVYNRLQGINNSPFDSVVYQQDNLTPLYIDTINFFAIYKFANPVPMRAGVFYIGTTQPASSGSDSLYIGFDNNRIGVNHVFFNTDNIWRNSLKGGALMIRPLLGRPVIGTGVTDLGLPTAATFRPYPNPATALVSIHQQEAKSWTAYLIMDLQGRTVVSGKPDANGQIPVGKLVPGVYLLRVAQDDKWSAPQKFIKQ